MTDFVLESAVEHSEHVLADRRWFSLDDEAWAEFQELLDAPAGETPRLKKLMRTPTVFDAGDE